MKSPEPSRAMDFNGAVVEDTIIWKQLLDCRRVFPIPDFLKPSKRKLFVLFGQNGLLAEIYLRIIPRYAEVVGVQDKPFPVMRWIVLLLGLLVVGGAIYDGGIFYSRWSERRHSEQASQQQETDHARKAIDSVGGGGLKILSFYAAPGAIKTGAHTNLCYGVTGAKNVQLDPPVGEIWPALTRCLEVSPRKETEYKLTADDGAGHSTTGSVVVKIIH
jgi:hypothetical protein